MLISRKRCQLRKYVKYDFYRRWNLPSISNHCENHTLRPWLAISWWKSQIFTKLFQQICLRLYGTRRRVALFSSFLPSFSFFLPSFVPCSFTLQAQFYVSSSRSSCSTLSVAVLQMHLRWSSVATWRIIFNLLYVAATKTNKSNTDNATHGVIDSDIGRRLLRVKDVFKSENILFLGMAQTEIL